MKTATRSRVFKKIFFKSAQNSVPMPISISNWTLQIRISKGISAGVGTVIPNFKMCRSYSLKELLVSDPDQMPVEL